MGLLSIIFTAFLIFVTGISTIATFIMLGYAITPDGAKTAKIGFGKYREWTPIFSTNTPICEKKNYLSKKQHFLSDVEYRKYNKLLLAAKLGCKKPEHFKNWKEVPKFLEWIKKYHLIDNKRDNDLNPLIGKKTHIARVLNYGLGFLPSSLHNNLRTRYSFSANVIKQKRNLIEAQYNSLRNYGWEMRMSHN
jgi:antitoxin component HigA of HigAB toxin-antitoxin module